MNRIIIDFPDDCMELDAVAYATGCFTPSQNDYKRINEGYYNGVGLTFGDGRYGYLYKTVHGSWVLKVQERGVRA